MKSRPPQAVFKLLHRVQVHEVPTPLVIVRNAARAQALLGGLGFRSLGHLGGGSRLGAWAGRGRGLGVAQVQRLQTEPLVVQPDHGNSWV